MGINQAAGNPSKLSEPALVAIGGLVLGLLAVAVVLLGFAISRFNRARHGGKQQHQHATVEQLADQHLARARALAGQLLSGEVPSLGAVWDVVLGPGERVLVDGTAGYSRYYGFGAATAHTPVSAHDHTLGGSGGRAHQAAALAAAARWRDRQECRVVLTDKRLLCQIQAKGWTSFEHAAATAIQGSPDRSSVVLEFRDAPPVRLSGPLTTEIMVVLVFALYGADGLREHPALTELRPLLLAAPARAASVAQTPSSDRQATGTPRIGLLEFVAARELTLAEHAARLLEVSEAEAAEQLEDLFEQSLVSRVRLSVDTTVTYRLTQSGADRVDGAVLPGAMMDLAGYAHAVALAGPRRWPRRNRGRGDAGRADPITNPDGQRAAP